MLINKYRSSHPLVKWFIHLSITLPVVSFLIVSLLIITFIFWPRNFDTYFDTYNKAEFQQASHWVMVSHGLNDLGSDWDRRLTTILKNKFPNAAIFALDWRSHATNPLTCSINAMRIGGVIARLALSNTQLTKMHLIGHSCGAFVNYGTCLAVKAINKDIYIKTTYLDPVTIYGGVFWDYGVKAFGSCADVSDTYYDTRDSVYGSNQAFPLSYSHDVTAVNQHYEYDASPHLWPIEFYIKALENQSLPLYEIKPEQPQSFILEAINQLPQSTSLDEAPKKTNQTH
ncbi:hypothetical protein [Flocculibacter collagenilyticus]|uniref:hypothetical protein n=1 Tax=Flocculibacter collagenilyticus TaxID=2744479 RepID=UPI0018F2FFDA|nr:hypothetical protein [Flocculibacter collagenilyticus]